MAVERLKKVTVICGKDKQDQILRLLQGLQKVQLTDLFENEENQAWIQHYFPEKAGALQKEVANNASQQLKRIRDSIVFITHNGDSKQKVQQLKRKEMSFEEAEASFDEESVASDLQEIETLMLAWEENRQATKEQQEIQDWANDWYGLDLDPQTTGSKNVQTLMATIPNEQWTDFSREIYELGNVYLESYATQAKETALGLVLMQEQRNQVQEILQSHGGKEERNPYGEAPAKLLVSSREKLEALVSERNKLTQQLGEWKQQVPSLQFAEEIYLARSGREESKQGMITSNYLLLIQGWLPISDLPLVEEEIQQAFPDGEIYLSVEDPSTEEIDQNILPIKLKNGSFVQPFEMLTEMYSLPKYDEIDPTPWMTPFYFVFYGMMVADFGYGLLMLIATTFALKVLTLGKGTARFMKLFQYLSVPTMIWGLIYGSMFGMELPFHLISPSQDFMTLFIISMIFGGIQLFTGLFLAVKENVRKKDYLAAVNQGLSWQCIIGGILVAVAGSMLLQVDAVTKLGTIIALLGVLMVMVTSVMGANSKVGGFFSGLYDLYGISGYIGDFVSYSRLMALGISGGSIAVAFNMLVGYLPPLARYTVGLVLIVVLHALNIFLSLLSAYVHGARLQYVEFFGKFYTGGGRPFKSFKPAEKYLNFSEKEKK